MINATPRGLEWRSSTSFILTTVALGLFTDLFLYGLPVPLLPFILEDRLHVPATKIQRHSSSLLAAHAVSSAVFCPVAGILTDKFSGRKVPYLLGVLVLLLAVILFFLGGSMPILVFARVLQGISGAWVWTVGQAILIDTVGAENVGKTTGSISGTISVGGLAAPVLGGILYHRTGVVGPLALGCSLLGIDFIMRLLMIEKKSAASWITLIQATLLGSLDATVPTVAQEYYDFNPLQTGLLFIPIVLPMLVIGPVAGWITDQQGSKNIVVAGSGLLVPLLVSLRLVQPGGLNQVLIYCFILTLSGTCLAATNPPALVESTLVVEKYHKANPEMFGPNGPYAQISSITGFMYNAGTALGPLLAGAFKDAVGYGNMNLIAAMLSLVTALLALFNTEGKPVDKADAWTEIRSQNGSEGGNNRA
ncbi:MAG: hypothetical protein Q9221_008611 [Calogaya cf. arnoldii]